MSAQSMLFGLITLETEPNITGAPFDHDRAIVGLSLIAALALNFAFYEVAAHARTRPGVIGDLWRAFAGVIVGLGVWTTHFVGLLAFETPLARGFQTTPTIGSALLALIGGVFAIVAAGPRPNLWRYAAAASIVALGGVLMHYWGVVGIEIEARLSFRALWAVLTAFGALVAALMMLFLAYRLDTMAARALAAFPSAAGMAGLHYMDMAATVLTPAPSFLPAAETGDYLLAALAITAAALVVSAGSIWLSRLDAASPFALPRRLQRSLRSPQAGEDASDAVIIIPTPAQHARPDKTQPAMRRDP